MRVVGRATSGQRLSGSFGPSEQLVWAAPLAASTLLGHAALAALLGAFLLRGFLCAGGRRISVYGCYCFAVFLFLVYAAFIILFDPQFWYMFPSLSSVLPLSAAAVWLTSLTYSFFHFKPGITNDPQAPADHSVADRQPEYSRKLNSALLLSALFLTISGALLSLTGAFNPAIHTQFAGAVMGSLLHGSVPIATMWAVRSSGVSLGLRLLLPIVAAYLQYTLNFEGFGRISLATIGLSALMVLSWHRSWLMCKWGILFVTPLSLLFAFSVQIESGVRGSSSFVSQISDGGTTIRLVADGVLQPTYGSTYLAAVTVWIPRAIWSDKPTSLGNMAVNWIAPALAGSRHSVAIVYTAEMYMAFGILAVLVGSIALGLILSLADKKLLRAARQMEHSFTAVLWFLGLVLFGCYLLYFVWAGSTALAQRAFPRIVLSTATLSIAYYFASNGSASKRRGSRVQSPGHWATNRKVGGSAGLSQ